MTFQRRLRLFLNVLLIIAILITVKAGVHVAHLEFVELDALVPSFVASAIFIIGFLLSGILTDYKEAEHLPARIRVALEAIYDDIYHFAKDTTGVDMDGLRATLLDVVTSLEKGLSAHGDMKIVLAAADRLSPIFAQLVRLGMSPNFIVRLRGEQDILRQSLYRIYHIQKIQFVPSIHVLVQTLVLATLFLLIFLESDGSMAAMLIFAFVSYMFVFALYLINILEQPFRKGVHSVDDVSIFLLREFAAKIGDAARTA